MAFVRVGYTRIFQKDEYPKRQGGDFVVAEYRA